MMACFVAPILELAARDGKLKSREPLLAQRGR